MKKLLASAAVLASIVAMTGVAFAQQTTVTTTSVPIVSVVGLTPQAAANQIRSELISLIQQLLVLLNQELANAEAGVTTSTVSNAPCSPAPSQGANVPWANSGTCSASSTTSTTVTTTY